MFDKKMWPFYVALAATTSWGIYAITVCVDAFKAKKEYNLDCEARACAARYVMDRYSKGVYDGESGANPKTDFTIAMMEHRLSH